MPTGSPIRPTGTSPALSSADGLGDHGDLALVAIERTRMPMVIADANQADTPIVIANNAFLKLCGYPADEVIGRNCRFLQGPDTDPASLRQIRNELATAERDFVVELLNYRKDGSTYWVQLFISPIRSDEGELRYFFASQLDITRQREAMRLEASERRLLREIDHRAKNALALVQGIVRLSRADDVDNYAEAVQGRVETLAQAHMLLSEANWSAVPIERVVTAVVAPFGTRQVSVDGPRIDVSADQVQPLALLLRELLANAAAHGALSTETGSLTIEWRRDADRAIVRLCESGGPVPPVERSPGFGLTMVDRFIRHQLRGDVAFDWHDSGLETVLTLPVAANS